MTAHTPVSKRTLTIYEGMIIDTKPTAFFDRKEEVRIMPDEFPNWPRPGKGPSPRTKSRTCLIRKRGEPFVDKFLTKPYAVHNNSLRSNLTTCPEGSTKLLRLDK